MQLDSLTLFAVSAVLSTLCAISFVLNTALRNNDVIGRIWSIGFVAAIACAFGFTVFTLSPETWLALIFGNMALPIAMGAMWSGARKFNGKSMRLIVVAAVAVVVGLAVILRGPDAGGWAGAVEFNLGVGLMAACASSEFASGRLKRNVNSRIATVVFSVVALFYAVRAVVLVVQGPDGQFFALTLGTSTMIFVNLILIVSLTVALSLLRAERMSNGAVGDFTNGIHSAAGVLSAQAFVQAATDHIQRAEQNSTGQVPLSLIGADIDNLPELNLAFGRTAGDDAIAQFAQILRRTVPALAVIGHPAAGRFLILIAGASDADTRAVVEQIQMAQVSEPLAEGQPIRLTASFGTVTTADYGFDLDGLTAAVSQRIDLAKASVAGVQSASTQF